MKLFDKHGIINKYIISILIILIIGIILYHNYYRKIKQQTSLSFNEKTYVCVNILSLMIDRYINKDILGAASNVRGESIQMIRLFCWINEENKDVRKEIMRQWLGQMRYEKRLPLQEELIININKLMNLIDYNNENKRQRIQEVRDVYRKMNNIDSYDVREDEIFFLDQKLLNTYRRFINKKYPLGTVLFSGNIDLINEDYNFYVVDKIGVKLNTKNKKIKYKFEYNNDYDILDCVDKAIKKMIPGINRKERQVIH